MGDPLCYPKFCRKETGSMRVVKRLLCVLFAVTVLLGESAAVVSKDTDRQDAPKTEYTLENSRFTNYLDGYSILLEGDYTVDLSMAEVAAILMSHDTRIEIYKQDLDSFTLNDYVSYSNGFLANTLEHHVISRGWRWIGGRRVYVTAWYRDKLQRVENDKNYYATFDMAEGEHVYSVFVKTAVPFDSAERFYGLVESFTTVESTEHTTPWSSKAADLEERGWNAETELFYRTYLLEQGRLSWGIYEPDFVHGFSDQILYYEKVLACDFTVVLCYSHFYHDPAEVPYEDMGVLLEQAWSRGQVLELTLQATDVGNGTNMMYAILQGEYDTYLRWYAKTIADFAHPVLFRLHNEMNGDWCPYAGYRTSKDPVICNEVYRYIYGIFEECGANRNTIWVWNPNSRSFPEFDWNHSLMYYPGDEYVDVVGMTAYNTGTYYARYGEKWQEFETLYADLYEEYCRLYAQPLMITEFSCANMGGDKNRWVENMFSVIIRYDRIKIAVWWDHCDYDRSGNVARSYVLDETPELLKIFRKNIGYHSYVFRGPKGCWSIPYYGAPEKGFLEKRG